MRNPSRNFDPNDQQPRIYSGENASRTSGKWPKSTWHEYVPTSDRERSGQRVVDRPEFLEDGGLLQPSRTLECALRASPNSLVAYPVFQEHIDESNCSGENKEVASRQRRGPVAQFGSALPWHGRGHRFDPDQVHQSFQQLSGTPPKRLAANWQQISNCRAAKPFQSSPSPL